MKYLYNDYRNIDKDYVYERTTIGISIFRKIHLNTCLNKEDYATKTMENVQNVS
jgi:hypothetical protein